MSLDPIAVGPDRCEYLSSSGLRIILDSITPTTKGLEAWCVIKNGTDTVAHGRLDLMSSRTVATLANEVITAVPTMDKEIKGEVRGWVSYAVMDAINIVNNGEPLVDLATVESVKQRWLLRPLIESTSATRLIAPGGSLKSLLALTIALTVATGHRFLGLAPTKTGPVVYFDWEADAATHAERMRALCKGAGIPVPHNVFYRRQQGSMYRAARSMRSAVNEWLPELVIIDSTAMARGASGEGAAEDSTIRMFSALRTLGRPALLIDHKSDEKMRKGQSGGYGSVYNQNLARLEWEVKRIARSIDSTSLVLRLEKANNVKTGTELGIRFALTSDDQDALLVVKVDRVEPANVISFDPSRNTNAYKIASFLGQQSSAKTVAEIALATGFKSDQVRVQLSRHKEMFENTTPTSAKGYWRLIGELTDEGEAAEFPDDMREPPDDHPDPF